MNHSKLNECLHTHRHSKFKILNGTLISSYTISSFRFVPPTKINWTTINKYDLMSSKSGIVCARFFVIWNIFFWLKKKSFLEWKWISIFIHLFYLRGRKKIVCEKKNVWKWKVGNINTYLVSSLFLNDLLIAHQPARHLFTSNAHSPAPKKILWLSIKIQ